MNHSGILPTALRDPAPWSMNILLLVAAIAVAGGAAVARAEEEAESSGYAFSASGGGPDGDEAPADGSPNFKRMKLKVGPGRQTLLPATPWGLADTSVACHVIGCHSTQDTRVHNARG